MEYNPIVYNAAKSGDVGALKTIVLHKPHLIDIPNKSGWTPMHVAAKYGRVTAIETLVQLGSTSIDTRGEFDGWTPLFVAVQYKHISVIETLIRLGSKAIDIPENTDWTPMHHAAWNEQSSTIETLVRLGSKAIDSLDMYGWTPMNAAVVKRDTLSVMTFKMLGAECKLCTVSNDFAWLLDVPIDEEESAKLRHRVYFQRSLTARLLFTA